MPDGGTYCVSGFGKGFDMRPLIFKDPVQKIRLCSLCNVIPNSVVLLQCSHSLCESCFGKCIDSGERCLLDQERIGEENIERLKLSDEKLATWKVACWNSLHGCTFSGPSPSLLEHFEKHCTFHAVSCSRCNNYVLRTDMVGHLKSGCTDLVIANHQYTSSSSWGGTSVGDLEKSLAKMRDAMLKMTDEHLHLQSSLNGLLENAVSQKAEIVKGLQLIGEAQSSFLLTLNVANVECQEQITRLGDNLLSQTMDIARNVRSLRPRRIDWHLYGWEKIKEEARAKPFAYAESEVQSLYGYAVSQNIEMKKQGDELRLHSFMRIHASRSDDELEWPFKYDCFVGLIHQKTSSKILSKVHASNPEHRENFKRPVGPRNTGLGSFLETVALIESRGFIENDSVHLFVEIIP